MAPTGLSREGEGARRRAAETQDVAELGVVIVDFNAMVLDVAGNFSVVAVVVGSREEESCFDPKALSDNTCCCSR